MSAPAAAWPLTVRLAEAAAGRPDTPLRRRLVADAATREAIAEELDLESLNRFEADLSLRGWFDGTVIDARWSAEIVQICGVELEPFSTTLEGAFCVRVVPQGSVHAPDPDSEVTVDPEADDPPDVLEGDAIDLSAYVLEHLALEIDPFPRRPGAVFEAPPAPRESSPFDVLKTLKPSGGDQ